jgi:hypothetical protein
VASLNKFMLSQYTVMKLCKQLGIVMKWESENQQDKGVASLEKLIQSVKSRQAVESASGMGNVDRLHQGKLYGKLVKTDFEPVKLSPVTVVPDRPDMGIEKLSDPRSSAEIREHLKSLKQKRLAAAIEKEKQKKKKDCKKKLVSLKPCPKSSEPRMKPEIAASQVNTATTLVRPTPAIFRLPKLDEIKSDELTEKQAKIEELARPRLRLRSRNGKSVVAREAMKWGGWKENRTGFFPSKFNETSLRKTFNHSKKSKPAVFDVSYFTHLAQPRQINKKTVRSEEPRPLFKRKRYSVKRRVIENLKESCDRLHFGGINVKLLNEILGKSPNSADSQKNQQHSHPQEALPEEKLPSIVFQACKKYSLDAWLSEKINSLCINDVPNCKIILTDLEKLRNLRGRLTADSLSTAPLTYKILATLRDEAQQKITEIKANELKIKVKNKYSRNSSATNISMFFINA